MGRSYQWSTNHRVEMYNQVFLPSNLWWLIEIRWQILWNLLIKKSNRQWLSFIHSSLTNCSIIICIECFVDRIDDMFNFLHVTRTQFFITFQHIFLGHFAIRTTRLKWKSTFESIGKTIYRCQFSPVIGCFSYLELIEPVGDFGGFHSCLTFNQSQCGVVQRRRTELCTHR